MDAGDLAASLGRVSLAANGGAAPLRGGATPEARARARWGPWGAGKGSGGFEVTRWTWLWARHRRRGTRGYRYVAEWPGGGASLLQRAIARATRQGLGNQGHVEVSYLETALEHLSDGENTTGPRVDGDGDTARRQGVR
jgi:hypothetical protein